MEVRRKGGGGIWRTVRRFPVEDSLREALLIELHVNMVTNRPFDEELEDEPLEDEYEYEDEDEEQEVEAEEEDEDPDAYLDDLEIPEEELEGLGDEDE